MRNTTLCIEDDVMYSCTFGYKNTSTFSYKNTFLVKLSALIWQISVNIDVEKTVQKHTIQSVQHNEWVK